MYFCLRKGIYKDAFLPAHYGCPRELSNSHNERDFWSLKVSVSNVFLPQKFAEEIFDVDIGCSEYLRHRPLAILL